MGGDVVLGRLRIDQGVLEFSIVAKNGAKTSKVTAAIMELVSCFDLCFRFVEHYLNLRINLFLFVTLKASQIQLGEGE